MPGSWAVEECSNNRQIISSCATIKAFQPLLDWREGWMIGWPVIGLLGGLPQAAHDGVPEVFSTEKRRACFALVAGPAACTARPEPPSSMS